MLEKNDLEAYQRMRDNLEVGKSLLADRKERWERENRELIKKIESAKADLLKLKNKIMFEAGVEYTDTGNKQLLGGLGIRCGVNLIYDENDALLWAQEHQLCLTLDKKAFEKIAKAQDIGFVKKENKITVTFPKKIILDEYEGGDGDE